MCCTCDAVKKSFEEKVSVEDLLKVIAFAVELGTPIGHFDELTATILGEELAERNTESERVYESKRNPYRDNS